MAPPIKIVPFGGMIPLQDDRILPNDAAAYAANTWLVDGSARGFRPDVQVRTLVNPSAKKVFRIPNDPSTKPDSTFGNSSWLEFSDADIDVVRTPVVNDQYERYYWAGPSINPTYNSLSRIQAGQSSYRLGVPAPLGAPSVTANGGTSDTSVTRAYLFTWVTTFGEEGAPSTAFVLTGKEDDTFHVTMFAPSGGQSSGRTLATTRIYRTVTSDAGIATYFFVAEVPIATLTYADSITDTIVSGQSQLTSTNWNEPPSTLKGIVAMPNGILAGWTGSDVYFCEPYRPHAWPSIYSLSVDQPIVGLGVYGQSLIVATKGSPTIITGVHPAQMAQSTIKATEPCLARGTILPTTNGVVYASPNGLILVNPGGTQNVTADMLTKEQWLEDVDPYAMRAVRHGTAYLATHIDAVNPAVGFILDGGNERFGWLDLDTPTAGILTDYWTGETLTIYSGKVWHFNPAATSGMRPFTWKSKEFQFDYARNLGAAKVIFTIPSGTASLNPTPNTTLEQDLASDQYALFKVYADGRHVATRELRTSGEIFKLPSGFKALTWQFEVTSRVIIESIEAAANTRELRSV